MRCTNYTKMFSFFFFFFLGRNTKMVQLKTSLWRWSQAVFTVHLKNKPLPFSLLEKCQAVCSNSLLTLSALVASPPSLALQLTHRPLASSQTANSESSRNLIPSLQSFPLLLRRLPLPRPSHLLRLSFLSKFAAKNMLLWACSFLFCFITFGSVIWTGFIFMSINMFGHWDLKGKESKRSASWFCVEFIVYIEWELIKLWFLTYNFFSLLTSSECVT